MEDILYEEGFFLGQNNKEIYYRQYEVKDSKAVIVISHGFCETYNKYIDFIEFLNNNLFSVYILEHRGHGNSGRLGIDNSQIYVEDFNYYIEDLKEFLDSVVMYNLNDRKLFLYAHSMGGGIGALFLETYPKYFEAAILNCPMLEIHTGKYPYWFSKLVSDFYCLLGKGKSYVLGHKPYNPNFNYLLENSGTSSEERFNEFLRYQKEHENSQTTGASYKWLNESFKALKSIKKPENIQKVEIPVLLFQAGKDTFVKPDGQNIFAKYAKNCKLIRIEEAKHEIYIERDEIREPYLKQVLDFYNKCLKYSIE